MIKKKPQHPKLYLKQLVKNNYTKLTYIQNLFNSSGERIIESEIIDNNTIVDAIDLIDENKKQLKILNNYINIQKRVLEKHQKSRNYDAVEIVRESILLMHDFEKEINNWILNNREI